MNNLLWSLFPALLLSACAAPTGITLPGQDAWVDGKRVEYVTTDISDGAMAAQAGVNHVPRLAGAVGTGSASLTERVYKFADGAQISVFASGPAAVGAAQPDPNYSPLWRLVLVRWKPGKPSHELRSEEAVLDAQASGDVELDVTGIVVNCPITRGVDGVALRGVR
ncbi:hypothetical protein ASC95_09445 [Pelomonas sp. Root1217]|uniref:DUF7482 domain-containing protein n=1 Tax=Pelomonas sp. Root1217 TaxID=1736430 RepID=UPI00070BD84B|nr:hypothetical protein [Pelomonas sp. Root1217]KQV52993.1 hypothetical protein ASC95_09445 [Pelomonas sp. Root1217]